MKKVLLILMMMPVFAWGQTVTIRPNGAGSAGDNGTPSTGAGWECVDEASANGDTDYFYDMFPSMTTTVTSSGLTSETITNVRVVVNAKRNTGTGDEYSNSIYPIIYLSSSNYYDGTYALTTSYADYTSDYPTNPATGLAWTVSDIANMEIGAEAGYETANADSEARITQIYAIVTYTGGGGGGPTSFPTKLLLQGTGK